MGTQIIGISAIEVSLPQKRMYALDMASLLGEDAEQLSKDIGVKQKPVLDCHEDIMSFALEASNNLIIKNKINPNDINLVMHASCGVQNKLLWSPAAKIQKELNAKNSFSFDIQNGCNSGNLALEIAANFLTTDPTKKMALIVVSDALSKIVDYSNPLHKCIFSFSDAASAILVSKNSLDNKLLSFSASTEAAFADSMHFNSRSKHIWMNDDPEEDKMLIHEYEKRYSSMIFESLKKIGKNQENIKYIIMNQGDHKLIDKLIRKFSLSYNQIYRSHECFGHLGGTDIFFGLKQVIDNKLVSRGDLVVLASSAIGFSWGASVIQI